MTTYYPKRIYLIINFLSFWEFCTWVLYLHHFCLSFHGNSSHPTTPSQIQETFKIFVKYMVGGRVVFTACWVYLVVIIWWQLSFCLHFWKIIKTKSMAGVLKELSWFFFFLTKRERIHLTFNRCDDNFQNLDIFRNIIIYQRIGQL